MTEHIVAVFDSATAADLALKDLKAVGIPDLSIRRYTQSPGAEISDRPQNETQSSGGFWSWLLGEETPHQNYHDAYPRDSAYYDHATGGGNVVLSVTLDDSTQVDRAMSILMDHHPLELDDETSEHGATSMTPGTDPSTSTSIRPSDTPIAASAPPIDERTTPTTTEGVIPLAEEQVDIGKRMTDRGTTRIRRYVTETPVERDVTLQGERVTIERRTPSEGASVAGTLQDRTVEVTEREEVPVVNKTARVVEEVAITKEATERTETVRDSVRRDQVEVEDGKTKP